MEGIFSRDKRGSLIIVVALISGLLLFSLLFSLARTDGLGQFSFTLLSGLLLGMILFLVASGLSIIFGLMDVLNFAHGAYFMIGAYISYEVHHNASIVAALPEPNIRFLTGVILAIIVGAILGVALERGLLRPLYSRPIFQLVTTFGISIILLEVVRLIWGTSPRSWVNTFSLNAGEFVLFGQPFNIYRLVVILMGMFLIFSIGALLQRTRIGIIIRAGVEDSQMVEALGINVRLVFTAIFTLGCAVAAFGGAVAAPFLGASNALGAEFLLGAIAAIILGGMGSYEGTAIASIIVGLLRAVMAQISADPSTGLPPVFISMSPMILLAAALLLKPSGLFGKE